MLQYLTAILIASLFVSLALESMLPLLGALNLIGSCIVFFLLGGIFYVITWPIDYFYKKRKGRSMFQRFDSHDHLGE